MFGENNENDYQKIVPEKSHTIGFAGGEQVVVSEEAGVYLAGHIARQMEAGGRRVLDDGDAPVRRSPLSASEVVRAGNREPRAAQGADFMARDFDEDAFRAAYGLGQGGRGALDAAEGPDLEFK